MPYLPLVLSLLVGLFARALYASPARALPDGFPETGVPDVPLPTALGFTPGGREVVISKPGRTYSYKDRRRTWTPPTRRGTTPRFG